MTALVIVTCIFTPYAMAFIQESSSEMTVFEQLMNLFFLVDMILVFYSAYLDSDYNTIDSHNVKIYTAHTTLDDRPKVLQQLVPNRSDLSDPLRPDYDVKRWRVRFSELDLKDQPHNEAGTVGQTSEADQDHPSYEDTEDREDK